MSPSFARNMMCEIKGAKLGFTQMRAVFLFFNESVYLIRSNSVFIIIIIITNQATYSTHFACAALRRRHKDGSRQRRDV